MGSHTPWPWDEDLGVARRRLDVLQDLNAALERMGFDEERMGLGGDYGLEFWPQSRWIACFAVTGGSEGHWVHVEAVLGDKRRMVLLGKTFRGTGYAYAMAQACALIIGA